MSNYYELETHAVIQKLYTKLDSGLTDDEALHRLTKFGPNELKDRGAKKPWKILWEQLTAAMVVILIVAAIVSAVMGDFKNAFAITTIVVLNALLGFIQEYKAEKAMEALKRMATPQVKVCRNGSPKMVSARELVPGDMVLLEAGNSVPADGRIAESVNLRIQEAALTGESEPVEKNSGPLSGDLAIADRRNMAYMGTLVTYGRGRMVVIETGMKTELGRIAALIQETGQELTPLQKRLDHLGKQLALVALGIVSIVFALGLFRGENIQLMFMTAVSLAVAAIPEGLPAVVTIALALGAQRMLERKALIRKLPAVETLGSVTVICSDKTGTLTENRMTVTVLDVADSNRLDLADYIKRGKNELPSLLNEQPALKLMLIGSALCNDASLTKQDSEDFKSVGDPTEAALVTAAAKLGILKNNLEKSCPRIAEIPFDSERKRMTTVHESKNCEFPHLNKSPYIIFTKGAVDSLLSVCDKLWVKDHEQILTEEWRKKIITANDDLAKDGMRILGLAFRFLDAAPGKAHDKTWEQKLTFVGIVGMIDPARPEVQQAVETCKNAGIKPIMITGDHPLTAQYIGKKLGFSEGRGVTGQDLIRMPAEARKKALEEVSVFARVAPEHKLKIVEALQKRGHIVAMTGDGINDAPALKKADIGIAMGIAGTDVSKEAADMILLDDNFATIVAAIEEGRVIYENIRKFIKYLMTTNSAEICIMVMGPFLGMPLPLLPLQILWINLVSDGPAALALGVEPAEKNTMTRPPYSPTENLFGRGMARHIIWVGLLMSFVSLAMGYWHWRTGHEGWQTMVFTTLALSQMGHALAIRSNQHSLFQIGLFSNKPIFLAVLVTVSLQIAVVYVPFLQNFFKTVPLTAQELLISIGLSFVVFLAVEIEKYFIRSNSYKKKGRK